MPQERGVCLVSFCICLDSQACFKEFLLGELLRSEGVLLQIVVDYERRNLFMDIVVVGSGAREHALAYTFERQGHSVTVTPGNAGVPLSTARRAEELSADLFVIGPEQPLVDGLADRLRIQGKLVFGPGADGAQLEGSKAWMKQVLSAAGVPTAKFSVANTPAEVEIGVRYFFDPELSSGRGCAIKTDGLAAGKGVGVFTDPDEAIVDGLAKLDGAFGAAGDRVVIEELLEGREVSLFAICNGRDYVLLPGACDYKRLLDGDEGPNTGGMGSYSPAGDEGSHEEWAEVCIRPVLDELSRRGIDYRGVLYAGLMITPDGPKVLEFNVRFGDPEIQSILMRSESGFAELLMDAAVGEDLPTPVFSEDHAVTVVLAAEGYPESPTKGAVITDLTSPEKLHAHGVAIFCAGVAYSDDEGSYGGLCVDGGRVLSVTALSSRRARARELAYQVGSLISWPGRQFRSDIAAD